MSDRYVPLEDLSPLEQIIKGCAYARVVYPLHVSDSAASIDSVVDSAERYADTIVRQFRESRARMAAAAVAALQRPDSTKRVGQYACEHLRVSNMTCLDCGLRGEDLFRGGAR